MKRSRTYPAVGILKSAFEQVSGLLPALRRIEPRGILRCQPSGVWGPRLSCFDKALHPTAGSYSTELLKNLARLPATLREDFENPLRQIVSFRF